MKINILKIVVPILIGILLSSCASILGGKYNTLVFSETNSQSSDVYIDGELVGKAPGKIKISKTKIQHGSKLTLKSEGYKDLNYTLLRKQHGIYSVVDLISGAIPLVIDISNGNIYRPKPRKFKYQLVLRKI